MNSHDMLRPKMLKVLGSINLLESHFLTIFRNVIFLCVLGLCYQPPMEQWLREEKAKHVKSPSNIWKCSFTRVQLYILSTPTYFYREQWLLT